MAVQPKIQITPEEYLAAGRRADFKSEYFAGEVFATAGASYTPDEYRTLYTTLNRGRDLDSILDRKIFEILAFGGPKAAIPRRAL